jgi:uncharacterized membrane protein (DUF106 family)
VLHNQVIGAAVAIYATSAVVVVVQAVRLVETLSGVVVVVVALLLPPMVVVVLGLLVAVAVELVQYRLAHSDEVRRVELVVMQ